MYVHCTILHYFVPFDATLHRLCVRCPTRHYPEPFDATLHRLCTVLQMSAKLFAIELVHFTISCSNSTWATRPFIIWLDYSCLGCSVSRRKTKPSRIWPCHSFISYSILQLIFRPALHSLIYLRALYFWWWRPPISPPPPSPFTGQTPLSWFMGDFFWLKAQPIRLSCCCGCCLEASVIPTLKQPKCNQEK